MSPNVLSRRRALGAIAAVVASALVPREALARAAFHPAHPDPRPGVTGANVLAESAVPARHRDAYRAAREIPEILDGLYCHCDCAERRGMRSLLSCFETEMPQSCGICLGEARLAHRLHGRGEGLAEIRAAIDRSYGERRDAEHAHAAHAHAAQAHR